MVVVRTNNRGSNTISNTNSNHDLFTFYDLKVFLLNTPFQFNAFKRGFELVTDNSPLPDLFRPEELEELVIGQRKYDWETFQDICEYDGGFGKNHETIKHVSTFYSAVRLGVKRINVQFWSVFDEMEESEKKMLLEFFTGSDRIPVGGLSRLKPKIQSSGPDSDRLPTGKRPF